MIKHFIYLDQQKMYSLSSQIFEGITEFIVNEDNNSLDKKEEQKGPVGSGKILADVINTSTKSTEKRFLHDYSYTIFENYLLENNKIVSFSTEDLDYSNIDDYSFIKIKAKAKFNDIDKINELFRDFNKIGESLTHVRLSQDIELKEAELKAETNPKKVEQLIKEIDSIGNSKNLKKLARLNNLQRSQSFLDNLSVLTQYGFSNQFEIEQNLDKLKFSTFLKRECLREKEDILIKKFSRITEKEIVVVGIITQGVSSQAPLVGDSNNLINLKELLSNFIDHLANIEHSISGKSEYEIIIDPIAVYVEL
ncbi:hypothetical protein [Halarcobacter sp.]|uniref:DUF6414 family protein n=1 Tax=Halarcobacter sp. TaxID=2321133 RepID=UPI002AAB294C|nr:hypothetical protein [Halarcobacter sp.]